MDHHTVRTDRTGDVLGRAIAPVGVACFAVHVLLLVATGTSMMALSISMLILSGVCVVCSGRAGSNRRRPNQIGVAAAAVTMIVLHMVLMPSGSHGADHADAHHGGMDMVSTTAGMSSSGASEGLMTVGLVLAGIQAVLALAGVARPDRRPA